MGPIILMIVLAIAIILIILAIAIMVIRSLTVHTDKRELPEIDLVKINGLDIAAHLAEVIQCQTVSEAPALDEEDDDSIIDSDPFEELHDILLKNYPLVSRKLTMEKINGHSLLYTWQGNVSHLPAVLFAAHQDVVPVDESSLDQWKYPPFAGDIAEGYVWGRGAMDIKCQMTALLDAVEFLLKQDFEPRRTIYLAFGHDEEIGGYQGAKEIAAILKDRGVRLGALVDEGGGVTKDSFPGINSLMAMIGVGEKGHLSLKLSVDCPPGHSSIPTSHTSIGILSKAITQLEENPMHASLQVVRPLLNALAPESSFLQRLAFTNLWFFGNVVKKEMEKSPSTNALLRTTTAVTMISGGIKDNILPPHVSAVVNLRLTPGDTIQDVVNHIRRVINDDRVKIDCPDNGREASPLSPSNSPAYSLLSDTIQQIFGETSVVPTLVTGATDARHYYCICQNVYRFTPALVGKDDTHRVHGIGERISVENLELMTQFFVELIQTWSFAIAL